MALRNRQEASTATENFDESFVLDESAATDVHRHASLSDIQHYQEASASNLVSPQHHDSGTVVYAVRSNFRTPISRRGSAGTAVTPSSFAASHSNLNFSLPETTTDTPDWMKKLKQKKQQEKAQVDSSDSSVPAWKQALLKKRKQMQDELTKMPMKPDKDSSTPEKNLSSSSNHSRTSQQSEDPSFMPYWKRKQLFQNELLVSAREQHQQLQPPHSPAKGAKHQATPSPPVVKRSLPSSKAIASAPAEGPQAEFLRKFQTMNFDKEESVLEAGGKQDTSLVRNSNGVVVEYYVVKQSTSTFENGMETKTTTTTTTTTTELEDGTRTTSKVTTVEEETNPCSDDQVQLEGTIDEVPLVKPKKDKKKKKKKNRDAEGTSDQAPETSVAESFPQTSSEIAPAQAEVLHQAAEEPKKKKEKSGKKDSASEDAAQSFEPVPVPESPAPAEETPGTPSDTALTGAEMEDPVSSKKNKKKKDKITDAESEPDVVVEQAPIEALSPKKEKKAKKEQKEAELLAAENSEVKSNEIGPVAEATLDIPAPEASPKKEKKKKKHQQLEDASSDIVVAVPEESGVPELSEPPTNESKEPLSPSKKTKKDKKKKKKELTGDEAADSLEVSYQMQVDADLAVGATFDQVSAGNAITEKVDKIPEGAETSTTDQLNGEKGVNEQGVESPSCTRFESNAFSHVTSVNTEVEAQECATDTEADKKDTHCTDVVTSICDADSSDIDSRAEQENNELEVVDNMAESDVHVSRCTRSSPKRSSSTQDGDFVDKTPKPSRRRSVDVCETKDRSRRSDTSSRRRSMDSAMTSSSDEEGFGFRDTLSPTRSRKSSRRRSKSGVEVSSPRKPSRQKSSSRSREDDIYSPAGVSRSRSDSCRSSKRELGCSSPQKPTRSKSDSQQRSPGASGRSSARLEPRRGSVGSVDSSSPSKSPRSKTRSRWKSDEPQSPAIRASRSNPSSSRQSPVKEDRDSKRRSKHAKSSPVEYEMEDPCKPRSKVSPREVSERSESTRTVSTSPESMSHTSRTESISRAMLETVSELGSSRSQTSPRRRGDRSSRTRSHQQPVEDGFLKSPRRRRTQRGARDKTMGESSNTLETFLDELPSQPAEFQNSPIRSPTRRVRRPRQSSRRAEPEFSNDDSSMMPQITPDPAVFYSPHKSPRTSSPKSSPRVRETPRSRVAHVETLEISDESSSESEAEGSIPAFASESMQQKIALPMDFEDLNSSSNFGEFSGQENDAESGHFEVIHHASVRFDMEPEYENESTEEEDVDFFLEVEDHEDETSDRSESDSEEEDPFGAANGHDAFDTAAGFGDDAFAAEPEHNFFDGHRSGADPFARNMVFGEGQDSGLRKDDANFSANFTSGW